MREPGGGVKVHRVFNEDKDCAELGSMETSDVEVGLRKVGVSRGRDSVGGHEDDTGSFVRTSFVSGREFLHGTGWKEWCHRSPGPPEGEEAVGGAVGGYENPRRKGVRHTEDPTVWRQ